MYLHFRVHHWVVWWFYVGIACGVVALVNVLFRDLTRTQEAVILAIGVLFWLLGGLVCYAYEGIQLVVKPPQQQPPHHETQKDDDQKEWHPASDFVLPGTQRRFLPEPRLGRSRRTPSTKTFR